MDSSDLLRFIDENHIAAELVHLKVETPTVASAAKAVGVTEDQIGKSLLFMVQGDPLLIIANGKTKIDYKALAKHLDLNRKGIRLANRDQVMDFTGYAVGTVPPFGHRQPLETLIEEAVCDQTELYAGGGDINSLLKISTDELLRVCGDRIIELRRKSQNESER